MLVESVQSREVADVVLDIDLLTSIVENAGSQAYGAYSHLIGLVDSVQSGKADASVLDKDLLTIITKKAGFKTWYDYSILQSLTEAAKAKEKQITLDIKGMVSAIGYYEKIEEGDLSIEVQMIGDMVLKYLEKLKEGIKK